MLTFGLVGCGDIAHLRAQALAKSTVCQLRAVADVDAGRAKAFAAKYGVDAAADAEALVERLDVDATVICTPPDSHEPVANAAFAAGKHVLCEKPLARTPNECRRMLDAAKASGKVLATGFNFRFYPSVEKARELFDAGAIGELDHIRAYCGYIANARNGNWLHDAKVTGGGALHDNGIHLLDTVLYFFGEPVEIDGRATSLVWNLPGCEENGFVWMRNAAGRLASVQASWTEWAGYKFSVEIYGAKGCILIRCFPMVTELIVAGEGKPRRRAFYFPKANVMEHVQSYRWIVVESFVKEFAEFAALVEGRKSSVASGLDGLRSVEVAHRACLR
ncbi:MAG: Gfo/Idh/MocA family oxidoreductase [Acidobacteriota bacterium]